MALANPMPITTQAKPMPNDTKANAMPNPSATYPGVGAFLKYRAKRVNGPGTLGHLFSTLPMKKLITLPKHLKLNYHSFDIGEMNMKGKKAGAISLFALAIASFNFIGWAAALFLVLLGISLWIKIKNEISNT